MLFNKFFVFLGILIGKSCLSEYIIGRNQLNGFNELEEAVIKIINNCCSIQEKTTLALIGDIPGRFIKRLSSDLSLSIILLDYGVKAENIVKWANNYSSMVEKVDVLIAIAPDYLQLVKTMRPLLQSRYYDTNAFVILLGWSPKNRYAGCDGIWRTYRILQVFNKVQMPKAILVCWNNRKGLKIFTFNGYTNYAPQPWQSVLSIKNWNHHWYGFVREFQNNESVCENLFFEKIHDLRGSPIKILIDCPRPPCVGLAQTMQFYSNSHKWIHYENVRRMAFIREFIRYVNATEKVMSQLQTVGKIIMEESDTFGVRPSFMRGVDRDSSAMYPHGIDCKFIVTQFRGNKTQLQKIGDIIDIYSWIGMCIVYLITLIFFKYFLGQPFIIGILNLCRLSANCGIITSEPNYKSRLYLGCLFFFIITMQGILGGNLAALLTHDIPTRQMNSIQDLADFGYTVYAIKIDHKHFHDPIFKGRIIESLPFDNCIRYVKSDYYTACFIWSAHAKVEAVESSLHVSDCIAFEYITNVLPIKWPLEKKINKFVQLKISGHLMVDFETMVGEKILLDIESTDLILDPEIMTISDLGFAFAIFGIGLGCAFISFIAEVIFHRLKRKVTLTRVVVLK